MYFTKKRIGNFTNAFVSLVKSINISSSDIKYFYLLEVFLLFHFFSLCFPIKYLLCVPERFCCGEANKMK